MMANITIDYSWHMAGKGSRLEEPAKDSYASKTSRFEAVRKLLASPPSGVAWQIHHIDITCDGCEQEPIVGARFKCSVCEDRDLCGSCLQALIAARVQCERETGHPARSQQSRPATKLTAWARELYKATSAGSEARWAQLANAVPCLDPRHELKAVRGGAEREVCLVIKETDVGIVKEFLGAFPPSACSCADVAWLSIKRQIPNTVSSTAIEKSIGSALRQWEALRKLRPPQPADAAELAARHGLKRGKWMLFARPGHEVDAAWARIAAALAEGQLGDEAKVSATPARVVEKDHVICVYTHDYLDVADVERVRDALRALRLPLLRRRMLYKPDIYTYFGIYARRHGAEDLGFPPSIYESELVG